MDLSHPGSQQAADQVAAIAKARALAFARKAMFYADTFGWPVFPLHWVEDEGTPKVRCSCGDMDCARQGKHPLTRHGFKDASIDPEEIELWSEVWPRANLAVATGAASRIAVIDIDGERGWRSVQILARQNHIFPPTATVRTASGVHLYYRHIDGLKCSASRLMPGVDVRAEGGQAVLPPSIHRAGVVYRWDPSPLHVKPRLMPVWLPVLLEQARSRAQVESYKEFAAAAYAGGKAPIDRVRDLAERVARTAQNSSMRNTELNRLAFVGFKIAKQSGLSDFEVMTHFMAAAKACGLPHSEAMATVRSAQRGAHGRG